MGYHAMLHESFGRYEDGVRYGDGLLIASCSFSRFTPMRQNRDYGTDFLEAVCYEYEGKSYLGDRELEEGGTARGVWKPDWERAERLMKTLGVLALEAGDEYTISRIDDVMRFVQAGKANPDAWVSLSY